MAEEMEQDVVGERAMLPNPDALKLFLVQDAPCLAIRLVRDGLRKVITGFLSLGGG